VPTIEDWNVYVNFVILAVTGRMGEADAVMRQRGDAVRSMAMWLRTGAPGWPGPGQALAAYAEKVTGATLWRGLLLEPEKIKRKTKKGRSLRVLQPDPQLTFLSFSFDRDVACWFADRESVISGYVAQQRPKATGWLARYDKARPRQILWISAWDAIPLPDGSGRAIPLAAAAAQYPGLPADQFAWNLQTQREVILDAEGIGPLVVEKPGDSCPPTAELDRRLAPPMFAFNPAQRVFAFYGADEEAADEPEEFVAPASPPRDLTPRGLREYRVSYAGTRKVGGKRRTYFHVQPYSKWGERAYGLAPEDDWSWRDGPVEVDEEAVIRLSAPAEQRLILQARKRGRDPL